MPMMSYPRESQSQNIIMPVPLTSTGSGYLSDDSLLTKDLPLAPDSFFESALAYHLQEDWMRSNSSSPLSSQSLYTTSLSDSAFQSLATLYPPSFSQAPSPTLQTAPQQQNFHSESDKLAYQTARRRAQNRESQRAFRKRKNNQIAELESKLSELQRRYEKLQTCFVELSGRLVTSTGGSNEYNASF